MNFSLLSLQNIAFPPYSRLGSKVLTVSLWRAFMCPKGIWTLSLHHSAEGWTHQDTGSQFFFATSFRIFMEKKSPVNRRWKPKVKVLAMTGNVFTLSCFLAHWMFMYFVQNQTSLPLRIHNSESCSEYFSDQCFRSEKTPQKPYFQPSSKAIKN